MLRRLLAGVGLVLISGLVMGGVARAQEKRVTVHLFGAKSCPHCIAEKEYLEELVKKYDWLEGYFYEVGERENSELLLKTVQRLRVEVNGVPVTVVGNKSVVGFKDNGAFKDQFESMIVKVREGEEEDIVGGLKPEGYAGGEKIEGKEAVSIVQEKVRVPVIGEIKMKSLSLPVLTLVTALLDGFNPCAMWVLLFLISLLLGMRDRMKMWILGGAFILASGVVYFLFLAAWLNMFIFLGFVSWVRAGIGLFALGVGVYYLRDYCVNKAGGCKISGDEKKKRVLERLGKIVRMKNFLVALAGIMALAVAVNMVELVCSAGLPAVYTQVLSLTVMPTWQHYLYLMFYILIFMLDDVAVFVVAMITLRAVGISGKYARYSHLVGGVVMLMIGILMLVKPEWLMFG